MNKYILFLILLVLAVSVIAPPPPPPPTPGGFGSSDSGQKSKTTASETPPTDSMPQTVEERLTALEERVGTIEDKTSGISAPVWVLIIIDLLLVGLVLYVWKNLQPKEPGNYG